MAPRPLNKFADLVVDRDAHRVELVRTAVPLDGEDELRAFWQGLAEATRCALDHDDWVIFTDLRRTRGRNDPQFERIAAEGMATVYMRFARSAVLVASAVGRMHLQRHAHALGREVFISDDEAEARAWLSTP